MTKQQFAALWAAFEKRGAWLGRRGGLIGGSYRRMCNRMVADGLLDRTPPYPITRKGMQHLRAACYARWANHGCMAYQDDLKQVEAAMIAMGMSITEAIRQ